MNSRRELLIAIGLCLLGAGLVLGSLSRSWVSSALPAAPPLPARHLQLTGAQLAPGTQGVALVGLAAVAGLIATSRIGRSIIGLLLVAAGLGLVGLLVRVLSDPAAAIRSSDPSVHGELRGLGALGPAPYVAILGATLLVGAGILVVRRGRQWTAMSARYEAPRRTVPAETSMWAALDRGEDPTGGPTAPQH